MSKVIDYLPPFIPRILINKNHLKQFSQSDKKNKFASNNQMEGFRHDYSFDANLLGNCDDVTSSLVTQLGWDKEFKELIMSSSIHSKENSLSSLLCHNEIEGIAMDRTLCFRTKGVDTEDNDCKICNDDENSMEQKNSTDEINTEVIICDGCSKSIQSGQIIMTCLECFDFDLCLHCFKTKAKTHFKGIHKFQEDQC